MHQTFALKDLGTLHYFLIVQITKSPTSLTLTTKVYPWYSHLEQNDWLKTYCHACWSFYSLELRGEPFSNRKLCRKIVGSLQYTTITRPNISFDVDHVCKFMHTPTTLHWQVDNFFTLPHWYVHSLSLFQTPYDYLSNCLLWFRVALRQRW